MEKLTEQQVDNTLFEFRLNTTLSKIKNLMIRIDDAITNQRTKTADKLLKEIDETVINFVLGDEVDMLNLPKVTRGQKI